jgi:hypothetical protein
MWRFDKVTKALEVTIDQKIIGIYVPSDGKQFVAELESDPEVCTNLMVVSGSDQETWYWYIDNIAKDSIVSFRMIETAERGVPAHRVVAKAEQQ